LPRTDNSPMKTSHAFAVLGLMAGLSACSPVYNWREIRIPQAAIKLLLPCKPDYGDRQLRLAAQTVDVHMAGCEADATMFTLAYADLSDSEKAHAAVAQWKAILLDNLQAQRGTEQTSDHLIQGAGGPVTGLQMKVSGLGANRSAVSAQALWFVRGTRAYQALTLGQPLKPDVMESFLSGIELQ
jgi:hypothetical protein